MAKTYYVIIIHGEGLIPQFLVDRYSEALTFDTESEVAAHIRGFWRTNRQDSKVQVTAVRLED